MKRYSEYKDSGIKWIGEIPEHWKMPKLNRVVSKVGSGSTPRGGSEVYIDEGIKFLRSQNIHFEGLNLDSVVYIPDSINEQMKNTQVQPFDVLLNITGGSIGRCFYVDDTLGKANVNQHVCIIRPLSVNYRFLKYFLQSNSGQSQVWFYQKGDREGLSAESIKTFRLPLPPLPEQQAIVTYLDTKVAKIDEYISIAEKKIAALEELKQTIIAEAVTRGIHKDVLMKDSGVKWIGMIPEHWKVMRLSQIAYEHFISNKKIHHQNLLSLSYGQIIRKDINGTNGLLPASFDTYQVVEEGNIILRLTDLQNDHKSLRVGLVKETGIITSAYLCLAPKNMVYSKFLYFQLHACDIKKVFYSMGDGLRQSLNYDGMRKLASVIPPLPEQQEIVTYIEAKVAKIDQLCQAERSQIEKLKEYKQRLISDVVTGKVKVTND